MLNGDGLRVVLWLSGCSHCCKGCHNPLTWDPDGGLLFDDAARDEIFEQLGLPYISGITFSGGDPLHPANVEGVRELIAQIREQFPDKTIWLYTGSLWEEIRMLPIVQTLDVLVDGEFIEEQKDVKLLWKGSANQRVIDVQATLRSDTPDVPIPHCPDYYTGSMEEGHATCCPFS